MAPPLPLHLPLKLLERPFHPVEEDLPRLRGPWIHRSPVMQHCVVVARLLEFQHLAIGLLMIYTAPAKPTRNQHQALPAQRQRPARGPARGRRLVSCRIVSCRVVSTYLLPSH